MFRNGKKILIIILLIVASYIVANFAVAETLDTGLSYAEETGLGTEDPRLIVANVIRVALGFLGVIGVGLIMYAGWLYMSANGEEEKVDKAKKLLTSAIIGLVIILSAFGIASFVLSRLLNATGSSSGGGSGGGGDLPGGGSDPYSNSFYLKSTVPVSGSSNVVRNVRVRFNFNKSVSSTSVNSTNFTVSDSSGDVPGTTTVSGKVIEFIPDGACPTNTCSANNCFEENKSITVTVNNGSSGVLSTGGLETNCTLGQPCTITFTTGTTVDCSSPTANLYFNSGQVCVDTNNEIFASATDDSGISNIEFFEGSTSIEDVVNPLGQNPFNTSVFWDGSGHTVGTSKTFSIDVYDLAYNTVNDSETTSLRAEHCCNGIIDADESEIDCGGSDCAACSGSACSTDVTVPATCSNTICASNFCSSNGSDATSCALAGYTSGVDNCCLCSNSPRIDGLSPLGGFCDGSNDTTCNENSDCSAFSPATCNVDNPNGKAGNFVTISGKYFGSTVGEVYFTGASGWILASLPNTVNSNCTDNWKDDEIIVVVPSGTTNGPIKVKNIIDGLEDSTNDNNGANIKDFSVNNITRPGICKLSPSKGVMNNTLTYHGINFESNNLVYFGDYNSSSVLGVNTSFTNSTTINSDVPNIETGKVTSYILNGNDIISNYIDFEKEEEPYAGPNIVSFEPVEGKIGQYITIKGSGFGSSQGTSHVYFDLTGDIKASYEFPDVCSDSFWSDGQVIVKVPSGLSDGDYTITMVVGSNTVNTSNLNPNKFDVDSTIALRPSLCKIAPIMGLNNSEISLWGEYFGSLHSTNSKVRFHLNHDQVGASISSWGLDTSASGIKPYKITTTIHQEAVSGGVSVVIGSPELEGNSLNLEIGSCSSDSDCGSQICCPSSSVEVGRCMNTINDCFASVLSSVYEWDFSTGSTSVTPPTSGDSCISLSWASGACNSVACPNSPGKCSLGEVIFNSSCGDTYCSTTYSSQCGANCVFDNTKSKCMASGSLTTTCSVYEGATILVGASTVDIPSGYSNIECKQLGTNHYWQINPNLLSCPNSNWELNINGWCTLVDSSTTPSTPKTCDICDSGFDCNSEGSIDNVGKCFIGGQVCSDGIDCVGGKCNTPSVDQCECCCRISNANQDCCASLTCAGDCGSDAVAVANGDPDPNIYGQCSGCRIDSDGDGTINDAEQVLSDLACNCSTSSGKYCDVDVDVDGNGTLDGVCRDCNQLPTTGSCSTHHATCCSDAMDSNTCKGGEGYQGLENAPDLTTYYCGYYKCDDNLANGCYGTSPDYTKIADKGTYVGNVYSAVTECEQQCQVGGGPGMSCYDTIQQACTLTCNTSYECIGQSGCSSSGSTCGAGDTTCACCCDPGDSTVSPVIPPQVNASGLECKKNQSPCDGDDRGLYCGCSEDSQCGTINTVGCGSDTCCRARPSIPYDPIPTDGATNVCRNALISATFNQKMDISSFTGNMIVVGDYGTSVCPSGTQYIAEGPIKKKNIIARIVNNISNKFRRLVSVLSKNSKEAVAYTAPLATNHYCAMPGNVTGEDIGSASTTIKFSLTSEMESNKKYYVIIKGDKNLDSNSGVLNDWGIGYKGPNTETFNGIEYKNSKIWEFTTGTDICLIDSVEVNPESKLFQEVGASQVFTSVASSTTGQAIVSIAGVYSWLWDWTIDNESVVKFSGGTAVTNSNNQTIVAQNKEDAKTYLNAKATITEDTVSAVSTVNSYKTGKATAYVFLCQNPWPAISGGTWAPWKDTGTNCIASTGTCGNTNYELYYCRDDGTQSTADDLPAFKSGTGDVIVRGSSLSLACTDSTVTSCTTYGATCGTGTCIYNNDLLKETYFFGEAIPAGTYTNEIISLVAANETTGGKVKLKWCPTNYFNSSNPTFLTDITNYNVYYSTSSGITTSSSAVAQLANVFTTLTSLGSIPSELSGLGCYGTSAYEYTVDGLTNGVNYYFVVSALNSLAVESGLSNENNATPSDTVAPTTVVITDVLTGEAKNTATVKWTPVTGVNKYKISYSAGNCTAVGTSFASEIVIDSSSTSFTSGEYKMSSSGGVTITDGFDYCLAMQAADSTGNYSAYSTGVDFSPFSVNIAVSSSLAPSVSPGDNKVDLTWEENSGAQGYRIIVIPPSVPSLVKPTFPNLYSATMYPDVVSSTICISGNCSYEIVNGNTFEQAQIEVVSATQGKSKGVANGYEAEYYIQAYHDCFRSSAVGTCYSPLSASSGKLFPLEVVTLSLGTLSGYDAQIIWPANNNDAISNMGVYIYYKGGAITAYPADNNPDFMQYTGVHNPTITLPSVAGTYNIIVKSMYCRWGTCYYSGASNEVSVTVPGP